MSRSRRSPTTVCSCGFAFPVPEAVPDDHAVDPLLSAVLTSYGTGETLTGMLGVLGPARREYTRVIPVVELLGRAVSERLDRREERLEQETTK